MPNEAQRPTVAESSATESGTAGGGARPSGAPPTRAVENDAATPSAVQPEAAQAPAATLPSGPAPEGTAAGAGPRYDAAYYAHGCGDRPYRRDDVWLGFFGDVAERIVLDIAPRTVLDAGCAMGFLVETLRARDVEAWGVDISEYAIGQVDEAVAPYCSVGSILEPFAERYDLITCVEVLEHLDARAGARAIANLCAHTDDVLFSSTPHDHREPTHENVQPPAYWAAAFARHGFVHDVEFDGSFLTPWAARFRRHDGPIGPVIAAYERRLTWLEEEGRQRRDAVAARDRTEGAQRRALDEAKAREAALRAESSALREELEAWRAERRALEGRWTWRLLARRWGVGSAPASSTVSSGGVTPFEGATRSRDG